MKTPGRENRKEAVETTEASGDNATHCTPRTISFYPVEIGSARILGNE